MKYLQLQKVSINPYTKMSKNETVTFEQFSDNAFAITRGATDCHRGRNKERGMEFSMLQWDDKVEEYISRGFTIIDDVKRADKEIHVGGDYTPIADKTFKNVLDDFIRLNNEFFEESYSKSIKDINPDNVKRVQDALIAITRDKDIISISDFNDVLMNEVWTYVPRRQNHLNRLIAHSKDDFGNIIAREQDMIDRLAAELLSGEAADKGRDILSANNIRERRCNDAEREYIKALINKGSNGYEYKLMNAWAVTNDTNEKAMNDYLQSEGFKIYPEDEINFDRPGITYLWHGTNKSNIWSIMKNGLYLNPALIKSGVRIAGKAYGYGSYFAPCMYKSLGYTGENFSYSRDLKGNVGYMLIFKVATGNPWYIYREKGHYTRPNHWEDFHVDHPGKHCCWAESGDTAQNADYRLRWDEVIVYQQCQSSLAYVVEIKQVQ